MKKLLTALVMFLATGVMSVQAQYTNHWYFGSAAGFPNTGIHLDFTTLTAGNPTVLSNIPMLTEEGSSSISDASGNPLFYTDGITVWNASTNVSFGTGFGGGSSSTQSAIVLPKPGSANQWLVFTTGANGGGTGLSYFTVTQTGSAPNTFTATAGPSLVAGGASGEGQFIVGSTKAGVAYWVISRSVGTTGQVKAFEVSTTGVVNTTPVTSTLSGPSFTNTNYNSTIGTIKSNTCQNKLAFTYYNNDADIVDFDAATGQVVANTAKRITGIGHSYGIEFSPNDDYLFITGLDERTVYTYNIATSTLTTLGTSPDEAGQLQLAPDGKIYMAIRAVSANPGYLGVISNPNGGTGYSATGLLITGVVVGGNRGFSYRGLPSFPKSLVVSALSVFPGDGGYCTGSTVNFSYLFGGAVASQAWTITPGTAGTNWNYVSSTNSSSAAPSVQFLTAGTYTVTVTITDECGRTYPKSQIITISNPLTPTGTLTCSGGNITMANTTSDPNAPNYIWYKGPTYSAANVIGTGSPATYVHQTGSVMPTQICVTVGTTATTTSSLNRSIAGAATIPGASESSPKVSPAIDVLADALTLKSFDLGFRFSGTYGITVTIRNSASTVVFTNTYTGIVYTAGTQYTVPVNTTLQAGTGYTITVTINSGTSAEFARGAWGGGTNAGEISYAAATPGTNSFVNLQYDAYDYNVVTTCATPACYSPPACALPVEWADFTVAKVNGQAHLNWSTFVEIDNDHFEVERSFDGENFTSIGRRAGHGNSSVVNTYSFVDGDALSGTVYYRIKQVDIDGKFSYSPVRTLDFTSSALVTVYPNPSAGSFNVQAYVEETLLYTVYDITGRVLDGGSFSGLVSIGADFTAGSYVVRVQSGSEVQTVKLIKQ